MPAKKVSEFSFGGVDSRSNPANFPPDRMLRCRNFIVTPSGRPRLRFGYSKPTQSGSPAAPGDALGPIHSAAYYEQLSGARFLLFSAGTGLGRMNLATGVKTPAQPLGSFFIGQTAPWGHFRFNNRIGIGNGQSAFNLSDDGTTIRPLGIPALNSIFNTPTIVYDPATTGTWQASLLVGYELYFVLYNPVTGHVGNRGPVVSPGSVTPRKIVIATSGGSLKISGLPNAAALGLPGSGVSGTYTNYPELVLGVGRTNDNGEVPYWLVDGTGNRITIPLGQTTATIKDFTIDTTQELPFRNGQPPKLNKFAKVSTKFFGAVDGDVNLHYTEDDTDVSNGDFVGIPPESWPPDNIEPFPTAEEPTSIHAYRFEGHFWSKNYLAVWSNLLYQQGANPWRGPWKTGCAGQRAAIETPYGFVWMTPDKELMITQGGDPTPISEEYEASLLRRIGDQHVGLTELAYYRNKELEIDRLYVRSLDANGNPVFVIHDFLLRDFRSQVGQAYEYIYSGMVPNTFVGSGYTPGQNLRDANGRERLWVGAVDQNFYQIEDGSISDNGTTYTGDCIFVVNGGDGRTTITEVQWQGDGNAQFSYALQANRALSNFIPAKTEAIDSGQNEDSMWAAKVSRPARFFYGRFLLTSHPADGNFDMTDPPFVPMPTYGIVNMVTAKLGASQSDSR